MLDKPDWEAPRSKLPGAEGKFCPFAALPPGGGVVEADDVVAPPPGLI